jgi:hypothetical protein
MGVSQQAVSKAGAELERLGYVERDARVRRLARPRGRAAVAAGRTARAGVADALGAALGRERTAALRATLLDALDVAGGLEAVRARRVPPVR